MLNLFQDGPFVWPKQIQGYVLGSFFYGYLISQVPAGMLAQRYSGKWVFALFYAISTIGTLITPMAARYHFGVLIVVRAIVGIGSVSVPQMLVWLHAPICSLCNYRIFKFLSILILGF